MTYLQLSILHISAIIILGNTLLMEERDLWYTPAHILGGWNYKLGNTQELSNEQADSVNISDERIKPLPTAKQIIGYQFALF